MGWGNVIGAVSAAATVIGAVGQYSSSKKAAKSQQRQIEAQQKAASIRMRQEAIEDERRRKEVIRQTLRERARVVAAGKASGQAGSSSLAGSVSSVVGSGNAAIGNINQGAAFNREIGGVLSQGQIYAAQAAQYQSTANVFGSVQSLGISAFDRRKDLEVILS